jgi:lysophospholipase L1-like esterase
MPGAGSNRLRRAWRWLVPLAILTSGVLIGEAYFRYEQDRLSLTRFFQPDPDRGWAHRPGATGWALDEGHVWVEINSQGLRDREHTMAKPPRTVRIAVLGDSFMESLNVPFEKAFVSLLERHVGTCIRPSGRAAETINFGVSGYNTAQELITYRNVATQYQPDIVLLAMFPANDIGGNHPSLNPTEGDRARYFVPDRGALRLLPPGPPVSVNPLGERPEAIPDHLPLYQRARVALANRSALARRVYQAYAAWRNDGTESAQQFNGAAIYSPPRDVEWTEAWLTTEALVEQFARDVRANGQEPWLVVLDDAVQTEPDAATRAGYARRVGMPDLLYPNRRLADVAARANLPVIMLTPPLAEYSARHGVYLNGGDVGSPGTGHWNETGNKLVAQLVGERLCADSGVIAGR